MVYLKIFQRYKHDKIEAGIYNAIASFKICI